MNHQLTKNTTKSRRKVKTYSGHTSKQKAKIYNKINKTHQTRKTNKHKMHKSMSGGGGLYDVNNFDFNTKISPPPKPPFGCSIL